jgi:hypothetical protein
MYLANEVAGLLQDQFGSEEDRGSTFRISLPVVEADRFATAG